MVTALPGNAGSTLYTRFGDWFAWTCVIVLLAAAGGLVRRPSRGETRQVRDMRPTVGVGG